MVFGILGLAIIIGRMVLSIDMLRLADDTKRVVGLATESIDVILFGCVVMDLSGVLQ